MSRPRRERREIGEENVGGLRGRVGSCEAVVALAKGSKENGGSRKEVWKPIAKRACLALEESGEHEIGVGPAIEKACVAGEENSGAGASEGHQGIGRGQERGVAVEVDVCGAGVSGPLAGGDGNGRVAALSHGEGRILGVGEDATGGGKLLGQAGEAEVGVVALNLEEGGDILGDSIAPEAVVVKVGSEVADFRYEATVGGAGMGRVIIALKGIAEGDNKLDR